MLILIIIIRGPGYLGYFKLGYLAVIKFYLENDNMKIRYYTIGLLSRVLSLHFLRREKLINKHLKIYTHLVS